MADYTTIDDPSAHFQTTIYSGDSSNSTSITNNGNSDLQADLVWLKNRTHSAYNLAANMIFDTNRGIKGTPNNTGVNSAYLSSEVTNPEYGNNNGLQSIQSDGFTPGSMTRTNETGDNFVAWLWKANGHNTSTNTAGTINSSVQANTTAGFSIFEYQGTGAAGTVGHGLGGLPELIIFKGKDTDSNWPVYTDPQKDGTLQFPKLNGNEAVIGSGSPFTWDTTKFTFSSASSYSNTSGTDYICYAFRSIQGYSKIDTYKGGGSTANGTFVYTGFQPAWILMKPISLNDDWMIIDNQRDPTNPATQRLFPNTSGAEGTGYDVCDMLSNGFRMRGNSTSWNGNGSTYLYMAFAEHPFVTSTGIPTTAR